ncbi:MAG: DUF3086 domain-containing protein [Cyanobacteria bacterium P01_D01_bin.105]
MPSEDNNPAENSNLERASGYEYSASDAAVSQDGSADSKLTSQQLPGQQPLGLQRSDRSRLRNRSLSRSSGSASDDSADSRSRLTGGSMGSGSMGDKSMGDQSMGAKSRGLASASVTNVQADIAQLVRQGLRDMEAQKQKLQQEIGQLEQRKARLDTEMKSNFAGASQEVAIRVQSFKNYLVGSLQDLATTAEDMDLVPASPASRPVPEMPDRGTTVQSSSVPLEEDNRSPLAAQRFAQQRDRINSLLDQYRTRPDYYGPPWQLRRTFEPIHAERASNWFFTQGGRGAIKSMGSRLQNVLVASAAISCMHAIYDRRLCVLVLATTPERLGEWRRWLQDCLGISRADFGTNRGVMLFEDAMPMSQRAERLMDSGRIPFLIMDEAEEKVSLSLLQYPLWLGFAPDPANPSTDYDYY